MSHPTSSTDTTAPQIEGLVYTIPTYNSVFTPDRREFERRAKTQRPEYNKRNPSTWLFVSTKCIEEYSGRTYDGTTKLPEYAAYETDAAMLLHKWAPKDLLSGEALYASFPFNFHPDGRVRRTPSMSATEHKQYCLYQGIFPRVIELVPARDMPPDPGPWCKNTACILVQQGRKMMTDLYRHNSAAFNVLQTQYRQRDAELTAKMAALQVEGLERDELVDKLEQDLDETREENVRLRGKIARLEGFEVAETQGETIEELEDLEWREKRAKTEHSGSCKDRKARIVEVSLESLMD